MNATINDRFFASAASKPVLVFPKLVILAQSHLEKIKRKSEASYIFYNKLIGEIMDLLRGEFPEILFQADQGRFIIGYYQQRQRFFEKKNTEQ